MSTAIKITFPKTEKEKLKASQSYESGQAASGLDSYFQNKKRKTKKNPKSKNTDIKNMNGWMQYKALSKKPKNMKDAANMLQDIRNDMIDSDDYAALMTKVDEIGAWIAENGKNTGLSAKLLSEASLLHDKLRGGSGKRSVRIDFGS